MLGSKSNISWNSNAFVSILCKISVETVSFDLFNMPLYEPPESVRHYFHRCGNLPAEGVDVVFSESENLNRPPCWTLTIVREATEDDLEENSVLNEIGESIWSLTLEITHCPYCGSDLIKSDVFQNISDQESLREDYAPFGEFSLFDQEKWTCRRR